MWNRIVKRVQSPRKSGPCGASSDPVFTHHGTGKALRFKGNGNRNAENSAPAANVKMDVKPEESFLKTLEGQFSKMQRERDAARFVSVSIANAAVSLKNDNHKELLDLQAKAIAWKCIAHAALDLKAAAR